jgi:hypothetical protein
MRFDQWALWGFVATLVLTSILATGQGLRLTRINFAYMLGTIFTPNRDKARVVGFFVHLVNGWLFALLYLALFHSLGHASWWFGAIVGVGHALFVLTAGMRLLPSVHPRMATEEHGPSVTRQLEPPGFLALNYGVRTPIASVLAHAVFGMVLGGFYPLGG